MSEWFIHFLHLFTQLYHVIPRKMMWNWVDGYLCYGDFRLFWPAKWGFFALPKWGMLPSAIIPPGQRWSAGSPGGAAVSATMAAATISRHFSMGKCDDFPIETHHFVILSCISERGKLRDIAIYWQRIAISGELGFFSWSTMIFFRGFLIAMFDDRRDHRG